MPNKSLVIIPTYNEKENITSIIEAVLSQNETFDVLIVDDNSPDGTATIVESLMQNNDRILIHKRPGKLGLGTAYIAGFKIALQKDYAYIFEMDADFSHDPKKLNELLAKCKEPDVDLVIGSRYIKGGGLENWSKYRLFLSFSASLYVRLIANINVMDPTAGFMCYSRKVLETIDLNKIKLKGYGFQIEMKYAAHCNDLKIAEVPIIFRDRLLGQSKMNGSIIVEAVLGVVKMKYKSFSGYYRAD